MPKKSMGGKRKRSADDSAGKPAKKAKKEERVDAASLSDGTNHNARLCKQLLEYAEICRSKISEDRVNVFRARGTKAAAEAIALMPVDLSTLEPKQIEKKLKPIKGVGKGTIKKIVDMVESGSDELEEVAQEKRDNPEFAAQQLMRSIPSVGTKSAEVLVQNHIRTPAQLEEIAARGVDELKTLGLAPAQAKLLSVTGKHAVDLQKKVPRALQQAQVDFLERLVDSSVEDGKLIACGAFGRGSKTMPNELSLVLTAEGSEVDSTHQFGLKAGADNPARQGLTSLVEALQDPGNKCSFEIARGSKSGTMCAGIFRVQDEAMGSFGAAKGGAGEASAPAPASSSSSSSASSSSSSSSSASSQFASLAPSGSVGAADGEDTGRAVMAAVEIPDLDEALEEAGQAADKKAPAASGAGSSSSSSSSSGPTPKDRAPESAGASAAEAAFEEARRKAVEEKQAGQEQLAEGNVSTLLSIHAVPSNHLGAAEFYHTSGQSFRETMQQKARKAGFALGMMGFHREIPAEIVDEDEDEESGRRRKAPAKKFRKDAEACKDYEQIFKTLGVPSVGKSQWSVLDG